MKRLEEVNSTQIEENIAAGKIYSLNCRSFKKHYEDIISDDDIIQSDIICLQETWINDDNICTEKYEIPLFAFHSNSYGRGKGIVIYYKKDKYTHNLDIKEESMQISKISSTDLDIIAIYRSQNGSHEQLVKVLQKIITSDKTTLVIGVFNFSYEKERTSTKRFFIEKNFMQLVTEPTHIDGHILDHAYLSNECRDVEFLTEIHAKYYSNHRGLVPVSLYLNNVIYHIEFFIVTAISKPFIQKDCNLFKVWLFQMILLRYLLERLGLMCSTRLFGLISNILFERLAIFKKLERTFQE